MRIISGEYRGRRLHSLPKGVETRPVPDMVKEALFNLLRGHFEDVEVIDVFAGSGSIGLEAASQGASRVVCVERDRKMANTLEDNIEMLGCEDRVEVAVCDALGPATLARCPKPAHIVFMDPPYPMVRDHDDWPRVKKQFERLIGMLDETGYAIIRTPWPFYHRELVEEESGAPAAGAAVNPARKDAQHTEIIEGEEMIEIDMDGDWEGEIGGDFPSDDELEGMAGSGKKGVSGGGTKDGGKPKYRTWDISLEMEGAHGPETHVYGSTAIHLYMRKVDESAS